MKNYFKLIILTVFLFQTTSLLALTERYQIINLGLQKYKTSKVTSINNQGWICGLLSDQDYLHIFVLDSEHNIALRKQPQTGSVLINNSNEIFGSAIFRVNNSSWIFDDEQAFEWINPFKYFQYFNFYYLGCPSGQYSGPFHFKKTTLWGLNDLGQAVVMNCADFNEAEDEFNKTACWIYDKNKFVQIADTHFQAGFKINNHSQILGSYFTGTSLQGDRCAHVSIYNYNDKTISMLNISSYSYGTDINDNGQIVGSYYNTEDNMWKGFLAEINGDIIDLQNFYPTLINNKSVVVGAQTINKKKEQITLWKDGNFYCLKDLVALIDDKGNTWDSIIRINGINDEGFMIGEGKINGSIHGLLLKPLSEK